jgi:hypothetical protein
MSASEKDAPVANAQSPRGIGLGREFLDVAVAGSHVGFQGIDNPILIVRVEAVELAAGAQCPENRQRHRASLIVVVR